MSLVLLFAGLALGAGLGAAAVLAAGWRRRRPVSASPPPPPAEPADEPADLPGPDQQVSFAAHIKPLFRESDRKSMSFAFDLRSADDVRGRATDILKRLQDGSMPCDGAWPAAKIEVFQRWAETGMQP